MTICHGEYTRRWRVRERHRTIRAFEKSSFLWLSHSAATNNLFIEMIRIGSRVFIAKATEIVSENVAGYHFRHHHRRHRHRCHQRASTEPKSTSKFKLKI